MKVSLKLQDERSPVLRAKIPVSIFSHPFVSSLTTATTVNGNDESCQNPSFGISTNFPSGPCLKLSYSHSSTASGPFSLCLKSGLGLLGSPHNSPLIFCAQFSLLSSNRSSLNPTFSLHFKPQFGNFSIRKATSSKPGTDPDTGSETHVQSRSRSSSEFGHEFDREGSSVWQEVKLEPSSANDNGFVDATSSYTSGLRSNNGIGFIPWGRWFLPGIAVTAKSLLPVTKRWVVNFRWSANMPAEMGPKMPYLRVNKIGIERVEDVKEVKNNCEDESNQGNVDLLKTMIFWMGRDLETLGRENKELKQCLEEMRQEASARTLLRGSESFTRKVPSSTSTPSVEKTNNFEQWRIKKNGREENGGKELEKGANKMSDLESKLQKAIKAAST
ncbi:hypothetical protein SLE2022_090900 [Rubroshorea leprosula]